MFLEKLKLQLFAANDDDDIDVPEIGEQDDDDAIIDEEDIQDDEEQIDEDDSDDENENLDGSDESDSDEDQDDDEDEKPFMVFKSKEDHQNYMDTVIGKRLGEQRELKQKTEKLEGIADIFKQYYGVTDIEGLEKKADELLDDIAYKRGTTKEELINQQKLQTRLRQFEDREREQKHQAFVSALTSDCEKLSKSDPDLYGDVNPDELMYNKAFLGMLSNGVPFKAAYDALNVDKLIKKQTAKAKKRVIDDVKAKGTRIKENVTKQSKAAVFKTDISKMTDDQIAELEERAANGEKIVF